MLEGAGLPGADIVVRDDRVDIRIGRQQPQQGNHDDAGTHIGEAGAEQPDTDEQQHPRQHQHEQTGQQAQTGHPEGTDVQHHLGQGCGDHADGEQQDEQQQQPGGERCPALPAAADQQRQRSDQQVD